MGDGRLSEGVIEYEVSYPKLDPSSVLIELLPTKMTMKFKDDRFVTDLSAGFGMFRMNLVNNSDDHEFVQMVKLIGDKYTVTYDEEKALKSLNKFPEISLKETGKTKMIANYECKEAIVTIQNDSLETYTLYFTDKIRLNKPNWFTQFTGIEGVLMEYQVERYNLCTHFRAIEVLPQEIEDEVFDIPEDYTEISEEEMDVKMTDIFNSFSE